LMEKSESVKLTIELIPEVLYELHLARTLIFNVIHLRATKIALRKHLMMRATHHLCLVLKMIQYRKIYVVIA